MKTASSCQDLSPRVRAVLRFDWATTIPRESPWLCWSSLFYISLHWVPHLGSISRPRPQLKVQGYVGVHCYMLPFVPLNGVLLWKSNFLMMHIYFHIFPSSCTQMTSFFVWHARGTWCFWQKLGKFEETMEIYSLKFRYGMLFLGQVKWKVPLLWDGESKHAINP